MTCVHDLFYLMRVPPPQDGHTLLMVACVKGSGGVIEAMLSVASRPYVDAAAMDHVSHGGTSVLCLPPQSALALNLQRHVLCPTSCET